MTISYAILIAIDLVAISILALGMYFPRHRRRDLVAAFFGVNVGVLAVSFVLGSSAIGVGLGLGLFGVLSIIRLRSNEIAQHEVAYYFASLALGLIAGLSTTPTLFAALLMALIVAVMFFADHPRLYRRARQQTLLLDTAIRDESALSAEIETLLGARVRRVEVRHLDLVNDTTLVEVRYELPSARDHERERMPERLPGPRERQSGRVAVPRHPSHGSEASR